MSEGWKVPKKYSKNVGVLGFSDAGLYKMIMGVQGFDQLMLRSGVSFSLAILIPA
jgi:hypothetical protein